MKGPLLALTLGVALTLAFSLETASQGQEPASALSESELFLAALAPLDGSEGFYHIKGHAYARVPGKRTRHLFEVEGFNVRRWLPVEGAPGDVCAAFAAHGPSHAVRALSPGTVRELLRGASPGVAHRALNSREHALALLAYCLSDVDPAEIARAQANPEFREIAEWTMEATLFNLVKELHAQQTEEEVYDEEEDSGAEWDTEFEEDEA